MGAKRWPSGCATAEESGEDAEEYRGSSEAREPIITAGVVTFKLTQRELLNTAAVNKRQREVLRSAVELRELGDHCTRKLASVP